MILGDEVTYSPAWWLVRLAGKLLGKRERLNMLQGYLDDDQDSLAPTLSKTTREAYSRLRKISRTNFAELIVEAPRERMRPAGFRTGSSGTTDTDRDAWRIWQKNRLDAFSAVCHRQALGLGEGFVIVGPVDDYIGEPLITVEDPREVQVEVDPRNGQTLAGLKLFRDDQTGFDVAYLYLRVDEGGNPVSANRLAARCRIYRARRVNRGGGQDVPLQRLSTAEWAWDLGWTDLAVPLIPVVRFVNKPDSRMRGESEFEAHINVLDRINYQVLQRLEIATLQAFKQRAIKGVPSTDANGNLIDYSDIFAADPGALWLIPETADIWESGAVDLRPLVELVREDVKLLAAVTRTPLYYLAPDSASGSAEGAALAREGLVFKVEDRIAQMSEAWEQVMRLAFLMKGDEERGTYGDTEVIWEPVERQSLAERYDAATKAVASGVPWRSIMEQVLQFSPQQVDRMAAERIADQLLAPEPATAGGQPTETRLANGLTPQELAIATNALGQLVRSGVTPDSAAAQVGLDGLDFIEGALPASLRPPEA